MSECTHDCSSCGADCSSRDLRAPANAKSKIKKVIAVVSGKGGVGKSTVTASLAAAMAKRGRKVAVLDADITGPSIPTAFGIHERAMATEDGIQPAVTSGGIKLMSLNLLTENETDPVIWRGPVIAGVVTQFWTDVVWGDVDYMFVDMPPGTGDVPLTVFQSLPVDGIIVVTSPQDLVSMIVTKAVHMAQMMSIPVLGLIENYSYYQCPDCGAKHAIFGESHLEQEAMQLGSFFVCGQKGDISMSECTHDCSSCGADCSSRDLRAPANAKSKIKKVIAVVSGKGGVGKSTVTASLAAAMAKRGRKVAVLDADITGPSIPTAFGIHERAMATEDGIQPAVTSGGIKLMSLNLLTENETDPVIWRGPVIAGVVTQFWTDVVWGDVDYMFVDMPPGTGDVPLTVFQSLPVDGIIVVTSPQDLVSMIVTKAVHMAQMMSIPVLGLIENYSYYQCPDCGAKHAIFGESHLEQEAMQLGLPLLAQLPIDPELAAAIDVGKAETLPVNYLEGVAEQLDV